MQCLRPTEGLKLKVLYKYEIAVYSLYPNLQVSREISEKKYVSFHAYVFVNFAQKFLKYKLLLKSYPNE